MHDVNFKLWNGKEHAVRFVGDFGGQWNLDWTQTKFCIINLLWRNFRLKSCVRSRPRSITQIAPKTSFLSCYYCTRCVVLFYSDSNDRRQRYVDRVVIRSSGGKDRKKKWAVLYLGCMRGASLATREARMIFISLANFGFPSLTEKL